MPELKTTQIPSRNQENPNSVKIQYGNSGPPIYVDKPLEQIEGGEEYFFTNEEYRKILENLVIVCSDVIIIGPDGSYYLAPRIAKPLKGWWFIGGRVAPFKKIETDEGAKMIPITRNESMANTFSRETKLNISPERFEFIKMNDYILSERQQEPQNISCQSLCFTYALKLTQEELDLISLDEKEYGGTKLQKFTIQEMKDTGVHQAIIDIAEKKDNTYRYFAEEDSGLAKNICN